MTKANTQESILSTDVRNIGSLVPGEKILTEDGVESLLREHAAKQAVNNGAAASDSEGNQVDTDNADNTTSLDRQVKQVTQITDQPLKSGEYMLANFPGQVKMITTADFFTLLNVLKALQNKLHPVHGEGDHVKPLSLAATMHAIADVASIEPFTYDPTLFLPIVTASCVSYKARGDNSYKFSNRAITYYRGGSAYDYFVVDDYDNLFIQEFGTTTLSFLQLSKGKRMSFAEGFLRSIGSSELDGVLARMEPKRAYIKACIKRYGIDAREQDYWVTFENFISEKVVEKGQTFPLCIGSAKTTEPTLGSAMSTIRPIRLRDDQYLAGFVKEGTLAGGYQALVVLKK